ncbi:hypothetical protein B0O99DRAFT_627555 [Bisporella sp. PMI_857]|nr:hypothetical protein B0O99DRAFT_627555 [Bisporella sp. PMI_857]
MSRVAAILPQRFYLRPRRVPALFSHIATTFRTPASLLKHKTPYQQSWITLTSSTPMLSVELLQAANFGET